MRTLRAVFRPWVFVAVVGWSLLILFEQIFGGSGVGGPACYTDPTCGAVPWIPPVVWIRRDRLDRRRRDRPSSGSARTSSGSAPTAWKACYGPVALSALGGVLLAFGIFLATSRTPAYRFHPPLCAGLISPAGFDIWTGQPHGRVMLGNDCSPGAPNKFDHRHAA